MKFYKVLPILIIPLTIAGCSNKKEEKTYLSLSETSITLSEDQTFQLTANIDDSLKNYLVFWSIRDEDIATVVDGLITAKQVGSTICSVQVGKYTADCAVNVTSFAPTEVLDITLPKNEIALNVNDTYELPLTVTFGNQIITEYQLSADINDTSIASFNDKTITALKSGTCAILLTATYQEYTANELITVSVY